MKTTIKILFIMMCSFIVLIGSAMTVNAAEATEYTLVEDGEAFTLLNNTGGTISEIIKSTDIDEIFHYLNTVSNTGVNLEFQNVETSVDITLSSGIYTLSGNLSFTGEGDLIVEGSVVSIISSDIGFDRGSLKLKDGTVKLYSGNIVSSSSYAVIMDQAAGALFEMRGGTVRSASECPAVCIERGTAAISDGKIISDKSYGIENHSTLKLAGNPEISGSDHGIISDTSLYLKYGEPFSGSLNVRMTKEFPEGTLMLAFYEASEASIEKIRLFDFDNKEQSIKFFEKYEGFEERNFAGVYKPHIVEFYNGDTMIERAEIIGGRRATSPIPNDKTGYIFSGWSTVLGGELFDFAQSIDKSMKFYARYKLSPPTFSFSSLSFIYDKNEHGLALDDIKHPLLDSAIINCVWYRNGVKISNSGTEIKIKNVNESGKYKCKLSFTVDGEIAVIETPEVDVCVEKAIVFIPNIPPKYYNGAPQSPDIFSTALYTVIPTFGTNVGIYNTELILNDFENYSFQGGGDTAYCEFEILKSDNFFTTELEIVDIYEGSSPKPISASAFGTPIYLYSSEYDGKYSEKLPDTIGRYYCKAYVSGNDNYNEITSTPVIFEILEEKIIGISIARMPDKTSYIAFERFDPTGLLISVSYNSSRISEIEYGAYSISHIKGEYLLFSDNYVVANYAGFSLSVPISVSKAEYDISHLTFSDTSVVYDGKNKMPVLIGDLPTGADGIKLEASLTGGGTDVGEYTVILKFSTDSLNYKTPESITIYLTVLPYECEAVYGDVEFVYDGTLKLPSAYYLDINGNECELVLIGGRSHAGEYTATADTADKNYRLINPNIVYKILKADYDFSNVFWSTSEFVYDGKEKTVSVLGLPSGVSVLGYIDNKAQNAGSYTARAMLLYDEENYNTPPELSYVWTIDKAKYDLSGFSFSDNDHIYDGNSHYPIISGNMPIGVDGHTLNYRFSAGAENVSDGRVRVEVIFSSESRNYEIPENIYAYVSISPKPISVTWQSETFIYNMSVQTPVAFASETEIIVLGGAKNAGTYNAIAVSLDENYTISNSSFEFVIAKAENAWIGQIIAADIYEGDVPAPQASAIAGIITYKYIDEGGRVLNTVPSESGIYYVSAVCAGDENYESITSAPVKFEIIKVVPISLGLSLNKIDYVAFDRINDEDISAFLVNNNGTRTYLDFSDLTLKYENSNELRYSDRSVTISYGDFTVSASVNVSKADYDMSNVRWSAHEFVYDGTEKSIHLIGLPKGVEVESYIGSVNVNSGIYPVSAMLSYDSHNYNPPEIKEGCLIIKKRVVAIPEISNLIYNGNVQSVSIVNTELYSVSAENGLNAGKYQVVFKLFDAANYQFENSSDEIKMYYEILPIEIEIKLDNVDKYLLSTIKEPDYQIISGSVILGDALELVFSYEGNRVICISADPNYKISFDGGFIREHNRLSDGGIMLLILLVLILLTILITIWWYFGKGKKPLLRTLKDEKGKKNDEFTETKSGNAENINTVIPKDQVNTEPIENKKEDITVEEITNEEHVEEVVEEVNAVELVAAENKEDENTITKPAVEKREEVKIDVSVDVAHADELITDDLARDLVRKEGIKVYTSGTKHEIINVDTLSRNFKSGETIDVNKLKDMSLVPYDTAYIKVLARGMIDKPLRVYANDFSLSAVKMLALAGGEAVRVTTVRRKPKINIDKNYKFSKNP